MAQSIGKDDEFYLKKFSALNLTEETFSGRIFEECTFKDCNFGAVTFNKCKFVDCGFTDCNLSNLRVPESRFLNVTFEQCKVIGIDWVRAAWPKFAQFPQLQFHKCILNDSSFFGLRLEEIVLSECRAHEVDFREGNFSRGNFTYADLARSLFGRTCLVDADFTEAINYDIDVLDNELRRSKFTRHEAVRLLRSFEIELVD
jgi:fluoroquinolone resistance protein